VGAVGDVRVSRGVLVVLDLVRLLPAVPAVHAGERVRLGDGLPARAAVASDGVAHGSSCVPSGPGARIGTSHLQRTPPGRIPQHGFRLLGEIWGAGESWRLLLCLVPSLGPPSTRRTDLWTTLWTTCPWPVDTGGRAVRERPEVPSGGAVLGRHHRVEHLA